MKPISKTHITTGCYALSAILIIILGALLVGFYRFEPAIQTRIKRVTGQYAGSKNTDTEIFNEFKMLADDLIKRNPFMSAPPKKGFPKLDLRGILGDAAFINGQWREVGDTIDDAEILEIQANCVVVQWKEEKKTFYPIESKDITGPEKKSAKIKRHSSEGTKPPIEGPANVEQKEDVEEDPLAWMGVDLPPGLRAKLLDKWNTLSDEQKEKFKEQWSAMSQEQKEKAVEQMSKNL